ncbi:hypothetical protein R3P38DRAFT_2766530 [Favolaschia claudopus]|uniref:Uncharacterized protein n=1 Tax=Favolaschia claudopus TaxID=2862362 RepID=A0AAW0CYM6_9AGAR
MSILQSLYCLAVAAAILPVLLLSTQNYANGEYNPSTSIFDYWFVRSEEPLGQVERVCWIALLLLAAQTVTAAEAIKFIFDPEEVLHILRNKVQKSGQQYADKRRMQPLQRKQEIYQYDLMRLRLQQVCGALRAQIFADAVFWMALYVDWVDPLGKAKLQIPINRHLVRNLLLAQAQFWTWLVIERDSRGEFLYLCLSQAGNDEPLSIEVAGSPRTSKNRPPWIGLDIGRIMDTYLEMLTTMFMSRAHRVRMIEIRAQVFAQWAAVFYHVGDRRKGQWEKREDGMLSGSSEREWRENSLEASPKVSKLHEGKVLTIRGQDDKLLLMVIAETLPHLRTTALPVFSALYPEEIYPVNSAEPGYSYCAVHKSIYNGYSEQGTGAPDVHPNLVAREAVLVVTRYICTQLW